jgi:hypothetical protein
MEGGMADAVVTRYWTEWVLEGPDWKSELVVETSLETTPGAANFSRSAIEEVASGAMHGLGGVEHHRIRIVPKERR